MSFADRIAACSVFTPGRYLPFRVDGRGVGLVARDFARKLADFPDVFAVAGDAVRLRAGLVGFAQRTAAVEAALVRLRDRGDIVGWRDEPYPVGVSFAAPPLFNLERAAVPLFGVRAYGVHVNGFVRGDAGLAMWIGRRSLDKPTAPGKLDQLVAGGQPAGLSLRANLRKECAEEADIPAAIADLAVPVGAVSYRTERPDGLRCDVLFVYDLELPASFQPRNTDGEITEFYLWPIGRVADIVRDTDDFKYNCALVVIDFLIRHGLIAPDHREYLDLIDGLHSL
ncbi:MAG: DUF4743 domain-containing protein [Rhodospirillales bacterium]